MKPKYSWLMAMTLSALFSAGSVAASIIEEAAVARSAINQSGVTALKALATVAQAIDGVVYEYELDDYRGRLVHEFKLVDLDIDRKYRVRVDVLTGEMDPQAKGYNRDWFFGLDSDAEAARQIIRADFTLAKAIVKAVSDGQQLMQANYEESRGLRFFEMDIVEGAGEKKRLVDINTGEVITHFPVATP